MNEEWKVRSAECQVPSGKWKVWSGKCG